MVRAKILATILCLVMGLSLGACGSPSQQATDGNSDSNPWSAEIQRVQERTSNKLVRGILEDGTITDAEIQEFMDSYNSCLAKYDLSTSYDRDNQYETLSDQFSQYSPEQMTQYNEECRKSTGYYDLIPLDENMHSNPKNISNDKQLQKIYDCRKQHKLVDEHMTFSEYRNIFREHLGTETGTPPANSPLAKYYGDGVDESDPDVQQWFACEAG